MQLPSEEKFGDYDKYREERSEASLLQKIQTNNNIDHNIQDILNAADKSIPNKLVTIESNDSPWIYMSNQTFDQKL